jgi:anthranilate phosphoribosyltransferase
MLRVTLARLIAGEDLTTEEAVRLFDQLLAEETADTLIAAVLVALAAKGETAEELAGFAAAMRTRCVRITPPAPDFIDTCGTGGSGAKTFNVSTAAAFVVAAAGIPVAKHGNVGVTSRAGSADVLRALGINVDLPAERVTEIFARVGICFMLAPLHHQATRKVGVVRRELGVRTIFNLLGPLTNPAGAPWQLIGVSDGAAVGKVARALQLLGIRRAWVVRGLDGLDEISLATPTEIHEIIAGRSTINRFEFDPTDYGIPRRSIDHLRGPAGGTTAVENAAIIRAVLTGQRVDEARDLVLLNAAAALHISGAAPDYPAALALAREVLASGAAWERLEALRLATN